MASQTGKQPEAQDSTNPLFALQQTLDIVSVGGGMAFAIAILAIASSITQSTPLGVLNHDLSPVFVTLYVGFSAGHYLGLAVTDGHSNFIDGAFGMFLVFSVAVTFWSLNRGMTELPIALLGLIVGLVVAHYKHWVKENEYLDIVIKVLGQGVVPLGLSLAVLFEIIAPLAMGTQIDEYLASLDPWVQFGILLVVAAALYLLGRVIGAVENSENHSQKSRT